MSIINIRLEINTEDFYKIKLNDQPIVEHTQSTIEFTSPILKDHKFSWLDIQGKVTIESLKLDGIDTDYFIHMGMVHRLETT